MSSLEILIIAFALAIDAFTVALAAGILVPEIGLRRTLRLAWHFGFFQGAMTIIGWLAGVPLHSLMERFDHWIAFGLLALVATRMILGAFRKDPPGMKAPDPTRGVALLMLSLATSIDALAVGMSFPFIGQNVWIPALVIGIVAAAMTALGLHLGRLIGRQTRIKTWAEIAGGVVLLGIGIKILFEHGVFQRVVG